MQHISACLSKLQYNTNIVLLFLFDIHVLIEHMYRKNPNGSGMVLYNPLKKRSALIANADRR